jgi:hypothetical protein
MIDAMRKMNGTVARTTGRALEVCESVESTAARDRETRQVVQPLAEEVGMPLRLSWVTWTDRHRTLLSPVQTRITRLEGTRSGAEISVGCHDTHPDSRTAVNRTRIDRFTSAP